MRLRVTWRGWGRDVQLLTIAQVLVIVIAMNNLSAVGDFTHVSPTRSCVEAAWDTAITSATTGVTRDAIEELNAWMRAGCASRKKQDDSSGM
jgi:hypothetical protein